MKMKIFIKLFFFAVIISVGAISCSKSATKGSGNEESFPNKYENELFSINMPKGWTYNNSSWKGLDSMQNEVYIYDPNINIVSFRCVKTFFPFCESIEMATKIAKYIEPIHEIHDAEVGGYPSTILYYANYVEDEIAIRKQFITYLEDSHIVIYFFENFFLSDWEEAEELGDKIINTIKIKKVENPLYNSDNLAKTLKEILKDSTKFDESEKLLEKVQNDDIEKDEKLQIIVRNIIEHSYEDE